MLTALTILHIIIALLLVLFVLLQDSKGDASGLIGGGGNRSVFGSTGASSFLVKATRTIAFFFAVSSIGLVYITTSKSGKSVIDAVPATSLQQEAPLVPESMTPADTSETPAALPEDSN